MNNTTRSIVIMGVSGCGKSTVGALLAERLGWDFADADDFHPPANRAKMAAGKPLDDADREPWLETLADLLARRLSENRPVVLACSALKSAYRDKLAVAPSVRFVFLSGPRELIARRLAARTDHFMPAALLDSQLASLETPHDAVSADISKSPENIVAEILSGLQIRPAPP